MKIKRIFDIVASFLGLIFLSPLFLVISFLLFFSKEGYIFFLQERIGLDGKSFYIWKFASMLKESPYIGNKTVTLRNDPRITFWGKYLRITKLNELPQLFNVLKGEMSLVGARPLLKKSYHRFTQEVQDKIYQTPPGITGVGSILFRDEEKLVTIIKSLGYDPQEYYTKYIYPYKGALELWYQDHISFATDLKILLLTFWQIVFPKSELTFRVFKNLPERPEALTVKGLQTIEPGSLGLLPLTNDKATSPTL